MKLIQKLPLFLLFLVFTACNKHVHSSSSNDTPACILKKIETFSKNSCEKGANVKEYTFQGNRVFVFDHGSCGADMTSEVVDKNCTSLGFLGGFTGNVKIKGEDFSNAVIVKTTWEK